MKRETKMAKTKNRIKKMNFQTQTPKSEPLTEHDKDIIEFKGTCTIEAIDTTGIP